ncbi:hypothetical protein [Citrobacter meridianamericanus]|uniref:hypothetical protein n=1 Tax=Citrobacter meridianamericanus TaxID=2894201 RepID=UPI00351D6BE2
MFEVFRIAPLFALCISVNVLAECLENERALSCFSGPSMNEQKEVHDRLSIINQMDNCKHWQNKGIEIPKKYNCDQLMENNEGVFIQYQIENCIYWKKNNLEMSEMYNCDQILKNY